MSKQTESQTTRKRVSRSPQILEVLRKHPNRQLTVQHIASMVNFDEDVTRRTLQDIVLRGIDENVHRVKRGTYAYVAEIPKKRETLMPKPALPLRKPKTSLPAAVRVKKANEFVEAMANIKPEPRIFREIGATKAGQIVAQDGQGNLYTVEEL